MNMKLSMLLFDALICVNILLSLIAVNLQSFKKTYWMHRNAADDLGQTDNAIKESYKVDEEAVSTLTVIVECWSFVDIIWSHAVQMILVISDVITPGDSNQTHTAT